MNNYCLRIFLVIIILLAMCVDFNVFGRELSNTYQAFIKNKCQNRSCIVKCCGNKEELLKVYGKPLKCMSTENQLDFSKITIYDKSLQKSDKKVNENFEIVYGNESNLNVSLIAPVNTKDHNEYLVEDGILTIETPNMEPRKRWKYFGPDNFCVEKLSIRKKNFVVTWIFNSDPSLIARTTVNEHHILFAGLMLLSCLFLAAVLVVYGLLDNLRNLRGLVLMSQVFSLFASFLVYAILNILTEMNKNTKIVCESFSFMFYFWFLSNLFWMNIMSLDIWWTFRGLVKLRAIHRRGEWCKYLIYCTYAWGVPLALTAMLVTLNRKNLRHIPWFITPQIARTSCFIEGLPRVLYLYVPMLIILLSNLMFFMLTVINMRRLTRDNAVLAKQSACLSQKNRFMIYLKLSAVMGINWIIEVITSIWPDQIWLIADIYNLMTGVFIFFIFICKKKIWRMLVMKWHKRGDSSYQPNNRGSSAQQETDTEISQSVPLTFYKTRGSISR